MVNNSPSLQVVGSVIFVVWKETRVRGITRSVSAQRWRCDGFYAHANLRHS